MIEVDLHQILPPGVLESLSEEAVQQMLADIAEAARDKWVQLAQAELTTSRRDYVAGVQAVELSPGMAVIALVGELPNIIEQGMDATDMHDTLLGPNVPVAPVGSRGKHPKAGGGYYRAIPFRHGTPTSGGASGAPMGRVYRGHSAVEDAMKLGKQIHAQAKKLAATTSLPGKGTKWGGKLPAGLAPKLKEHHKTDIYAGMVRNEKTYTKTTQSSYSTFRTISTGSPGWMRPATEGRNLAEQVSAFIAQLAPQTLEAYLNGASK